MDKELNLLRTAFDTYLARLSSDSLEPSGNYLPYEFDHIDEFEWRPLGKEMVKDELNEITNILNYWQRSLQRWQAWNTVIEAYNPDEAWELRWEFLETRVHHCLLQPSAIRDTFTFIATNSMHQVRLASEDGYHDYLDGDLKLPGDKPKYPTRHRKEQRLDELISAWPEAAAFMAALRRVDDAPYRQETSDYRNRCSHSIGPRLGIGITRAVVRSVQQATQITQQSDGTFKRVPIPATTSVSYGFGGTAPLDMEKARISNLEQYQRARECYEHYRNVLAAGMTAMRPVRRAARETS